MEKKDIKIGKVENIENREIEKEKSRQLPSECGGLGTYSKL